MKKILITTLFFASVFVSMVRGNGIKEQMMQVNAQWSKQLESDQILASLDRQSFRNFNEQITLHLQLVERVLRSRDMTHLSAEQKGKRMHLLDQLALYHQQARYPVNDYLPYKNPVFIDRNNTHCAVGYLMMVSGHDALAQEINAKQKFAYVHEIKVEGVKEWADEFGFTTDELAWIQPGYPPSFTTIDLSNGLNGTVTCTAVDPSNQFLFAGGEFTQSISGQPCSYIAQYISGFAGWDWVSVGAGLNGKVNAMVLENNKLYVGGEFTTAGGNPANHVAMYDLQSGQWQSLGALDSAVNSLAFYNNELYAGGRFTGMVAKWDGNQWLDFTSSYLYGTEVRTLEVFDSLLYIGGKFELFTGALRKNVMAYDGNQVLMSGFGTPTPVNDFAVYNNRIYAACEFVEGIDTCALSMLEMGDWQTVLSPGFTVPDFLSGTGIKSLLSVNQHLYAAGHFTASALMVYGSQVMEINLDQLTGNVNSLNPLLIADSTANSLFVWNNNLGFAGAFVDAGITLNHIGVLSSVDVTGTKDGISNSSLLIYPNPVANELQLHLTGTESWLQLNISDLNGKNLISSTFYGNKNIVDVSQLAAGFYLATLTREGKTSYAKFIKR